MGIRVSLDGKANKDRKQAEGACGHGTDEGREAHGM